MDIPPVSVHQRVPIILGSKDDVEDSLVLLEGAQTRAESAQECKKYYEKCDDPTLKERPYKTLLSKDASCSRWKGHCKHAETTWLRKRIQKGLFCIYVSLLFSFYHESYLSLAKSIGVSHS